MTARLRQLFAVVLVVFSTAWPASASASTYRVRLLPTGEYPVAINRWGTVVAENGADAIVIKRHSITTIPRLSDGAYMEPTAISDDGMVVGLSFDGDGSGPLAWTRADGTWDLGGPVWSSCEPGFQTELRPEAVNTSGLVVGENEDLDCNTQPVWWDASGMHLLASAGRASDVNEQGQAVGTKWGGLMSNGQNRASGFVWQQGHPLRVFRVDHSDTQVWAINDHGVMIGATHLYDSVGSAWLWVPGHKARLVSPLIGFDVLTNRRIYGRTRTGAASWNTDGRDRRSIRLLGNWDVLGIAAANDRGQLIVDAYNAEAGENLRVLAVPVRRR